MKSSDYDRFALGICRPLQCCRDAVDRNRQSRRKARANRARGSSPCIALQGTVPLPWRPVRANPAAGLINVSGTLYGTTEAGGSGCGHSGCGTVFSITTTGSEKPLYSFHGRSDGHSPAASFLDVNDTLYGTAFNGGGGCGHRAGCGTVYSMSTAGNEQVLYCFCGGAYTAGWPDASLIKVKGTLYGTTRWGGATGAGAVFSVTPGGKYTLLHSFGSGYDGVEPEASLIDVNGTLYGTTTGGGSGCASGGCGTVFPITTTGKENVLYSFAGGSDAAVPYAGLIDVNGTLYGTTDYGGANDVGTVFSITTDGTEKVLYSFGGGSDGARPLASLTSVNGALYGTTFSGGISGCDVSSGCGTVFSVTTTGTENVLHRFGGGSDGSNPRAGLIAVNGTLYGTTEFAGKNNSGTVFAISP